MNLPKVDYCNGVVVVGFCRDEAWSFRSVHLYDSLQLGRTCYRRSSTTRRWIAAFLREEKRVNEEGEAAEYPRRNFAMRRPGLCTEVKLS